MSVANIMPGDRIAVEMDYSEMLIPDEAIYEFVYPTVVGPRYAGGADPVKDKWMANPHLPAGTPEPYKFDIKVHLETGIAIKELSSPSHQVAVNYAGPARADVRLGVPGGGKPRLRAALPAVGRQDRERPPAVGGRGRRRPSRELLRADDGAAPAPDAAQIPGPRVHLPASTCRARCTGSRSTPRRR
jgi:hypothetical protein